MRLTLAAMALALFARRVSEECISQPEGGMYWRVKAKCLRCSLHFVVCTLCPDRHTHASLHCPECGSHDGNFGVWRQEVQGFISEEVPGKHDAGSSPWPAPDSRRLASQSMPRRRKWWQFWMAGSY